MPDHVQVMSDGGLVEERVLVVQVDEDSIETFCISDCAVCGAEGLEKRQEVYVWGEPRGGFVSLGVHCSETCVQNRMTDRANTIGKDIIVVFVG